MSRESTTAPSPSSSKLSTIESARTFADGEVVAGRYRICRFLARGGMGEVYEAEDQALQQVVALKTIRPTMVTDQLALDRFKREIQTARRVTHHNVCRIHDLGTHRSDSPIASLYPNQEILFVTMELLRGESLDAYLESTGPLDTEAALPLLEQMAAALDAAHAAGVIHRDFKSANVMLEPSEGGGTRVVVTDFGLARGGPEGEPGEGALTVAGSVLGSPAYMAPEQLRGGETTPAVDLYALGITLYEMVTGQVPFTGDSPLATATKRLSEDPPPPRELREDLEPLWEQVILRLLEREPEKRFASAGEVVATLRGEEVAAPSGRVMRRAMAAGFLLALAVFLNYWAFFGRKGGDALATLRPPAVARSAVALMGFRNVTDHRELAWLSAGLAEMLGSELAVGGGVRVIPGENVVRAKLELGLEDGDSFGGETLATLRQNLGADYVVNGSYTALGEQAEQLRLDIRLQNALDENDTTAVRVSGAIDQIFDLVADAGSQLRSALKAGGSGSESGLRMANAEVARLYAEGLEKLRRYDAEGARELLERAATADPKHPLIRSALAKALAAQGWVRRAEEEAKLAMELSAGLDDAERLEIQGQYFQMSGRWGDAAAVYNELWRAFSDNVDYGLELARALSAAGQAEQALQVAGVLRLLPSAAAEDVRIAYAEAAAAGALGDFRRQQEAAAEGVAASLEQGARLLQARGLLLEGWALRNLGEMDRARELTAQAEELYREAGDVPGVARATAQLGALLLDQGQLEPAKVAFEEAVATYRELGDKGNEALAVNSLAVLLRRQGESDRALQMYRQSAELSRETGNRLGIATSENNIGVLLSRRGELDAAAERFGVALNIARALGDRSQEAYALYNLGSVDRRRGRLDEALRSHEQGLEMRRSMGQRPGEAASLSDLGTLALYRGSLEEAEAHYGAALSLSQATGNRRFEASSQFGLAGVQLLRGDLAEALRLHRDVFAMRQELGEVAALAESRLALARIALEEGRFVEAESQAAVALGELDGEGAVDFVALAQALRGLALAQLDRSSEALDQAQLAWERARRSENVYLACDIRVAVARTFALLGAEEEAATVAGEAARLAAEAGLVPLELEALVIEGELALATGDGARSLELRQEVVRRARGGGLERIVELAGW